ncbi:hypothetical protein B6U93_03000 [Candidatus Woesearchaeota archaeon ex4484_78]|nr:MAG: hypothetical protein B6U93_03000 [Candidatus Woesearchaeota archaeon ex4484_78]
MADFSFLYDLKKFGMRPSLDNIRLALRKLGDFHKGFRVVHITGTNGKGSTAAMVSNVLKLAGFSVGLFTSPHLVRFNERIQVNGVPISDDDALRLVEKVRSLGVQLSFFEFVTVLALLYFKECNVDFVVLEVGLGGSWDATNVCDAEIAVLTPIGLDHVKALGDSVEKITRDKCGIIKKGSKVVTCRSNLVDVIKGFCRDNLFVVSDSFEKKIGLLGDFQKVNAGLAESVCRLLGVSQDVIDKGIETVFWPGRLEFVEENVLVDCAHNPFAVRVVTNFVKKNVDFDRLIVVFGVLADKDFKKMIRLLPRPDFLILTKPKINRALDPVELVYDGPCAVVEDPFEAFRFAKNLAKDGDLIFVTGSCFLVGNIKELYQD